MPVDRLALACLILGLLGCATTPARPNPNHDVVDHPDAGADEVDSSTPSSADAGDAESPRPRGATKPPRRPPAAPTTPVPAIRALDRVLFELDEATLPDDDRPLLALARTAIDSPDVTLVVIGARALDETSTLDLPRRRADAVAAALMVRGVARGRIQVYQRPTPGCRCVEIGALE